MKDNLIEKIKLLFKEEKKNIIFDNINIDKLPDECFLKNAHIIYDKENDDIISYQKFQKLEDNLVEHEISILKKSYFSKIVFELYFLFLKKEINICLSIFNFNKHTQNIIKKLQFEEKEKLFSFCVKNPYFEPNQHDNCLNDDNYNNGCYLFFELDFLNQEQLDAILRQNYNYEYIVFFLFYPNEILNNFDYKISHSYYSTNNTFNILKRLTKKNFIINPNKYLIIDNLRGLR